MTLVTENMDGRMAFVGGANVTEEQLRAAGVTHVVNCTTEAGLKSYLVIPSN